MKVRYCSENGPLIATVRNKDPILVPPAFRAGLFGMGTYDQVRPKSRALTENAFTLCATPVNSSNRTCTLGVFDPRATERSEFQARPKVTCWLIVLRLRYRQRATSRMEVSVTLTPVRASCPVEPDWALSDCSMLIKLSR
jgi:hypothetical protein